MAGQLTKYGFFKGGQCEKRIRKRYGRTCGGMAFMEFMRKQGYLSRKNGWYRIRRLPKLTWEEMAERFGGDGEIGAYRVKQDLVPLLKRLGRAFRWSELERWVRDLASFELGIAAKTPLSIITPGEGIKWGYAHPKGSDVVIYDAMEKDDVLKGDRKPIAKDDKTNNRSRTV